MVSLNIYPYICFICRPLIKLCPALTILLLPALSGTILAQTPNIDQYDIIWDSPSKDAGGSMPCGGGDIGLNVWVGDGDLLFYIARSGTFDENNSLLKLGRIRIRLKSHPLKENDFRQELVLHDGSVVISGRAGNVPVKIKVWVDVMRPVVHVGIDGDHPLQAEATYESWRTADRIITGKATNGTSYKWAPQHAPEGHVIAYKDSISYQGDDVLFFHHNKPGLTVFDVTVRQQGLDSVKARLFDPLKDLSFGGLLHGANMRPNGTVHGKYLDTEFTGWRLISKKAARHHDIELYLATTKDSLQPALAKLIAEAQTHKKTALSVTAGWWKDFWNKSFIDIPRSSPARSSLTGQSARNYQLFRYMLGCNAYGQYPTKFNGGLFTFDPCLVDSSLHATPDYRKWSGGTMTAQNQRLVYWPMLRSGDFDRMIPQFEFYLRILHNAELRTAVYWGHHGACFTEQLENFGLPNPAEYGWNRPATFDKGIEYNDWLEYEWDTVLEFCLMMLETERYTGKDIHRYIPFIGSCLRFFDEHYQYLARLRGRRSLDSSGHLILYPSSGAETYKMAYNSTSTIAGLHTVLTRLLALPAGYLDDSQRKEWTALLHRLPPISFRQMDGHTTIAPAQAWARINNTEQPQLYPVFPWGIYGLGRPGLDTAINTYKYDTDVIRTSDFTGWKQTNIFAARLGLTGDAARYTGDKLKDGPHRFPAFWGPGYDWTPDHNWGGSGMIGLQEMLLQDDGDKIYLFPAWPRDIDVHFKLYAPHNTTVEATLKDGKVTQLIVTPRQREKDIFRCL
ncbi:MAG TPA: DUF5703 domain-containing protein [Puia sp.]|jgi:hypothetical protein|nr:DUF5703 domain-containing protein [Puia sp.]